MDFIFDAKNFMLIFFWIKKPEDYHLLSCGPGEIHLLLLKEAPCILTQCASHSHQQYDSIFYIIYQDLLLISDTNVCSRQQEINALLQKGTVVKLIPWQLILLYVTGRRLTGDC
jgi:hypothetical protein